jgi:hypothetical protein
MQNELEKELAQIEKKIEKIRSSKSKVDNWNPDYLKAK